MNIIIIFGRECMAVSNATLKEAVDVLKKTG
ncbi:TPA_asm: transcriptional repressor, partial [Listeria monocytogenes]|nr:transcriptional repressor [Listeria monocytogenes]HAC4164440.1 transcriptional repressor [Listeria monocytogenes]